MGRVRDELPLRREHGADPVGHVVESHSDLLGLLRPGDLGPRLEVALFHLAGSARELAKRPRERVRQEPRQDEPEQERGDPDRGQSEHALADAVVHGLHALGHPHGAHDPPAVRDRHRAVQEILAERVAVALALGRPPTQCGADLRPRRERARRAACGIGSEQPVLVDHDHPRAELRRRARGDLLELRACTHRARGLGRDDVRLAGCVVPHLRVHAVPEVQGERNLERDEDQQEAVREGGEDPEPEAHSSSGEANRKPTPADRVQEARLARVVAELPPQPADVHVERLHRPEPLRVPHFLEDALALDDRARVLHQQLEQLELLAAQLEDVAVQRHLALGRIEAELSDLDRLVLGRRGRVGAAQHRSDACDHLAGAERLDHVVVGAQLEADDPVRLLAAGGEHDDRNLGGPAELAADVEARPVGQHHVEEHQVGVDL